MDKNEIPVSDKALFFLNHQVIQNASALLFGERWAVDMRQPHGSNAIHGIALNQAFLPQKFEKTAQPCSVGVVGPWFPFPIMILSTKVGFDPVAGRLLDGKNTPMPDKASNSLSRAFKSEGIAPEVRHFFNE